MPTPSSPEIRPIREDELEAWFEAFTTAFYIWHNVAPRAMAEARRPILDLDRAIGAFEGARSVGTFRTFGSELTLPGGALVPVNAVTGVSVRPTHRRRGILSAMNADDVRRAADRADAASVLIASEWPIYGRFGYGPATWAARWTVRTRAARFLTAPVGDVELVDVGAARQLLPEIYERHRASQPGAIRRDDVRWDFELGIREWPGRPRWFGSVAIHRAPDGTAGGYARYHGEEQWEQGIPDNVLILDELLTANPEAELALWAYLVRMDLTATVRADTRRPREPWVWHLADARAARQSRLGEMLWVRILDVPRILSNRAYDRSAELVLEVLDEVAGRPGPAAGRYRLEASPDGAACRRTDAAADITLGGDQLGAAVLGGTRLVDATRARPPVESRAGVLRELDALLRTPDEPWCATWF
ncbi:MAG: GNAT family N-acetyltransferase [Chloroflexi bacterium]|nr:GNAT family N-acetyltransferase [Chloroflexota bacterium]